ncbi:MAG: xylose isomerase, partial [Haliscomenobacter sp.]|nr:xylose isomerase [Haliscomenobacter sp.]
MNMLTGSKEYFSGIGQIAFEGPQSKNPLAFRYYDAARMVGGKTLKDHFRFAVAYWHSLCNTGSDPFGSPTKPFPWLEASDPVQRAKDKMDAAFEL